jgi:hypothetical protein
MSAPRHIAYFSALGSIDKLNSLLGLYPSGGEGAVDTNSASEDEERDGSDDSDCEKCDEFTVYPIVKLEDSSHVAAIAPGATTLAILSGSRPWDVRMPPQWWTNATLTRLFLHNFRIEEIPQSIRVLRNLIVFHCMRSHVKRIPGEIGRLPALRHLELYQNELLWIPSTLDREFDFLYLGCNQFPVENQCANVPPKEVIQLTADQICVFRYEFAEAAIGLQDLGLPALVTLEILDALCPNAVRMAAKWDLVVAVKHFRR